MDWISIALERAGAATLEQFQTGHSLVPTGKLEPETMEALLPYLYGYLVWRIEKGDTFFKIAQRFGTTVKQILAANPQMDPNRLPVGELVTIPLPFSVVPTDVPFSAGLLRICLRGLQARYPFLQVETIARTAMGRPVLAIRIGNGKRVVCWNGAHHANEWITTPVLMKFLEDYAQSVVRNGAVSGQNARILYEAVTLHIVPMVNPDGVDLVVGEATAAERQAAMQMAAHYPQVPFPDGWKANLRGVDLNLQYPAQWELARERKFAEGWTQPGPKNYVGEAPLQEVESAALYAYTRQIAPDCILAYHTQGMEIYWEAQEGTPEGAQELGEMMAAVSGYKLEPTPAACDAAGYRDWFVQKFWRPGYTIEAGLGENPLPIEQFEEIYNHNLGILMLSLTGGK